MLRNVFAILIGVVMLIVGIAAFQPAIWIASIYLLIVCTAIFVRSSKNSANIISGNAWTERFPAAKYSFGHGEFGIAVEEQTEKIHLMDSGRVKSYPFTDVRSWKTNLQTGGTAAFVGGGAINAISVGSANRNQLKENEKATGLFVSVRDVDKPVWRIKFSDKQDEEEKQQARWMEILNQVVNKA